MAVEIDTYQVCSDTSNQDLKLNLPPNDAKAYISLFHFSTFNVFLLIQNLASLLQFPIFCCPDLSTDLDHNFRAFNLQGLSLYESNYLLCTYTFLLCIRSRACACACVCILCVCICAFACAHVHAHVHECVHVHVHGLVHVCRMWFSLALSFSINNSYIYLKVS